MTQLSKKQSELFQVRRFAAAIGVDFTELEPGETPDFAATVSGEVIGIEITEIYVDTGASGSPAKALESRRRSTVARASRHYATLGGPAVRASILFSSSCGVSDLTPVLGERIAQAIHDAVNGLAPGDDIDLEYPEHGLAEVTRISIRLSDKTYLFELGAAPVHEYGPSQVQLALDRKIDSHAKYPEHLDQSWIVVVVDGFGAASFMEPDSEVETHQYTSPFDRCFVLHNFDEVAIRLRHSKPLGPSNDRSS